LAYYYYNILEKRYTTQEIPERVLGEKIFNSIQINYRPLPQFVSSFDSVTFYWNKPGKYKLAIFDTDYEVEHDENGLRVHNSDTSRENVCVIGDSHAYGIGVENNEVYSSILAYNAIPVSLVACSSFGTVREFEKAKELIVKGIIENPEILVIHFSPNDTSENMDFVNRNFTQKFKDFASHKKYYQSKEFKLNYDDVYSILPLVLRPLDAFEAVNSAHHHYLSRKSFAYFKNSKSSPAKKQKQEDTESNLLDISRHYLSMPEFSQVKYVYFLLAASPKYHSDKELIRFESILKRSAAKLTQEFPFEASTLLIPKDNDEQYYFHFDDHLNSLGHQWYADQLMYRFQTESLFSN